MSSRLHSVADGNKRFLYQDVPGDGSFFFHCLSVPVGAGLADSKMLKNVVCGCILQNWQEWESKVTLFHDNINTKQLQSHKMIEQNWWATSAEITAASVVL